MSSFAKGIPREFAIVRTHTRRMIRAVVLEFPLPPFLLPIKDKVDGKDMYKYLTEKSCSRHRSILEEITINCFVINE